MGRRALRVVSVALAGLVWAWAQSAGAQAAEAPPATEPGAEPAAQPIDAMIDAHAEPSAEPEERVDDVATELALAPRSIEERYVDALAGTWAASGILIGAVGIVGASVGLGLGCSFDQELGCALGVIGGSIFGSSLGWIIGPAVGVSVGAGLDFLEGLGAWALGLGTHLVSFGLGLSIGHAIDETQRTWGLGRVWGMISGLALGALAQMFLTPLYAVLLFRDRRPTTRPAPLAIQPFVVPRPDGAWGGLGGAF